MKKISANTLRLTMSLGLLALIAPHSMAASPAFQDFLFSACSGSAGDLATRCSESNNGDLSGDSEDSLNPTQSLSNSANALLETRTRIQALQKKQREQRQQEDNSGEGIAAEDDAMEVFQMSGLSVLLLAEGGYVDRDASSLERGYETDSVNLQIGIDYRLADNWSLGAVIGAAQDESEFDADQAGVNFNPGSSEGSSDTDSFSISVFTTANITESIYIEGLVSYKYADYTFERIGIFQESQRDPGFNRDVMTSADTEGDDFSVGLGAGIDIPVGAFSSTLYANLDYQEASIDSYRETGGDGFAMSFDSNSSDQTLATLGVNLSRVYNGDVAVWVPMLFVQYEYLLDEQESELRAQFLGDNGGASYEVTGDSADDAVVRAGIGLVAVRPNGFSGFVKFGTTQGDKYLDQYQINAGVRLEY